MATTNKENFKVKYSGSAEPEFLFSNVEEIKKPKIVRLTKKLPSWAEGTAFTVFPAKWDFKEDSLKHLYDGFAMMLKVEVGQENVTVVSKYLESEAYKKACQAQRAVMPEIGTQSSNDSSKSLFSRITNVVSVLFFKTFNVISKQLEDAISVIFPYFLPAPKFLGQRKPPHFQNRQRTFRRERPECLLPNRPFNPLHRPENQHPSAFRPRAPQCKSHHRF